MVEELLRRAGFADHAAVDEEDPVADLSGKAHLVGHDDAGHAALRQLLDHLQHPLDHLRVQGAGGLVKEHDLRVHGHGPHDGKALLLSPGELPGIDLGLVGQTHLFQQLHGLSLRLVLRHAVYLAGGQGDVLQHGEMGENIELLEHHADALAVPAQVLGLGVHFRPVQQDLSRAGRLQQVQAAEKGGFAAAGGADHGDHLAPVDLLVNAPEHLKGAEILFETHGLDQRHLFSH